MHHLSNSCSITYPSLASYRAHPTQPKKNGADGHQSSHLEMLWIYGVPVRSTWYSIMENKMTGRPGIKADSSWKFASNLYNLNTINCERERSFYALALKSFWIYKTVSMSRTPFAVSRPCSRCKRTRRWCYSGRVARKETAVRGDGKRESVFGLCWECQLHVISKAGKWQDPLPWLTIVSGRYRCILIFFECE